MGLITLCKNYLRWTQAVVLAPLIVGARRPWLKVAWSMLLVTTTAAFVVQSYFLVTDHLLYKTSTEIRLIYEPQAPFPAVTFCNLNPFKKSMVEHSQELTNLVATYIYVIKVKQSRILGGTTAAARTTATGMESHERKKREAAGTTGSTLDPATRKCIETRTKYNVNQSDNAVSVEEAYSVWKCSNNTSFMTFEACGDVMSTKTLPDTDMNNWTDNMLTTFYKCFYRFCTDNSRCDTWATGIDMLKAEEECLRNDGNMNAVVDGIVAQALANHCGYPDATCSLVKEKNTYSDTFSYHTECSATTTVAEAELTTEMTPTTSTLETTTTHLTLTTVLSTTRTTLLTTTDVTETATTRPTATTTDPLTMTSVEMTSGTKSTATATTTDAIISSTTSRSRTTDSPTTISRKASLTTAEVFATSDVSTSATTTNTSPLEKTRSTTTTSTGPTKTTTQHITATSVPVTSTMQGLNDNSGYIDGCRWHFFWQK